MWPYPRSLLWVVGFGFFFAAFDAVTISYALPIVVRQFGVSSAQAAWTISSSLLGYILGAFLDSRIADRFGRRLSLVVSVSLFTVGSLLSATSPQLGWLVAWRLLAGMSIGAEIAAVSTYIGELAPAPSGAGIPAGRRPRAS